MTGIRTVNVSIGHIDDQGQGSTCHIGGHIQQVRIAFNLIGQPGRFGIRLEDIVILRSDGPEILSNLPRDAVHVSA